MDHNVCIILTSEITKLSYTDTDEPNRNQIVEKNLPELLSLRTSVDVLVGKSHSLNSYESVISQFLLSFLWLIRATRYPNSTITPMYGSINPNTV